jgi:hypothetical protein
LLPGQLTQVDPSAADKFILKEAQWFTVDYQYASRVIQDVTDNYKGYLLKSRKQTQYVKDNFSLEKMAEKFCGLIDKGLSNVPQQVSLNLPKLKKVNDVPKINLPKLKKVEA